MSDETETSPADPLELIDDAVVLDVDDAEELYQWLFRNDRAPRAYPAWPSSEHMGIVLFYERFSRPNTMPTYTVVIVLSRGAADRLFELPGRKLWFTIPRAKVLELDSELSSGDFQS